MTNEKCPKCGAELKRGKTLEYECGAYLYSKGDLWYQSDLCEAKQ